MTSRALVGWLPPVKPLCPLLSVMLICRRRCPLSPPAERRSELVNETAPPVKIALPGLAGSGTEVIRTLPVCTFTSKCAREPEREGVFTMEEPPPPPPPHPARSGSMVDTSNHRLYANTLRNDIA